MKIEYFRVDAAVFCLVFCLVLVGCVRDDASLEQIRQEGEQTDTVEATGESQDVGAKDADEFYSGTTSELAGQDDKDERTDSDGGISGTTQRDYAAQDAGGDRDRDAGRENDAQESDSQRDSGSSNSTTHRDSETDTSERGTIRDLTRLSTGGDQSTGGRLVGGNRSQERRAPDNCDVTHGMHVPGQGVMHALVLFIRYKDEEFPNSYWPVDGFPRGWEQFIDSSAVQRSDVFHNLTTFYREASANANQPFVLIGRADTVTANMSVNNPLSYGESNRLVLKQVEDRFDTELGTWLDQWTRSPNCHQRKPDGSIDKIIMIWRTNRFNNTSLSWGGIANIGGGGVSPHSFLGKDIRLPSAGANFSSGVTVATRARNVENGLLDADVILKNTVHEIAHQHLTFWHPQGGSEGMHRFPSMLAYPEQEIHTHSGLEADYLGWGRVTEVRSDTTMVLPDFYSSGKSVWVETSGYRYLIENRQKTSHYDDATRNPDDRGLFVYRYRSRAGGLFNYNNRNDHILPLPSEGFYDWRFSGEWLPGWRATFIREDANPESGSSFAAKQVLPNGQHHWIHDVVENGQRKGADFRGAGFWSAYNIQRPRLGPDTNPSVQDFELEVLEESEEGIRFRVLVR